MTDDKTTTQPAARQAKEAKSELEAGGRKHTPTPRELAAVKAFFSRAKKTAAVRLKITPGKTKKIQIDHDAKPIGYALVMDSLGSSDQDFMQGILSQLATINSQDGKVDQAGLNFMFSVIKGNEPRDQLEAMLAAQMAAIHVASMKLAHRLAVSRHPLEQDSAERALNKLMRTFTTQMEALKRYRTGSPHTVQNISVSEGGQAIVANVGQQPSEPPKAEESASSLAKNVVPLPARGEPKESILPLAQKRKSA